MSKLFSQVKDFIESRDLTDEQRQVCLKEGSFVVKSCPGSGKTRTVGTRFAWRVANWNNRMGGIAAISFTNIACEEMRRHIKSLGLPYRPRWPHFLGTIHSFVDQFIFLPFGHEAMGIAKRPEIVHPDSPNYSWVIRMMEKVRIGGECRTMGCSPTSFEYDVNGHASWCVKGKSQPERCKRKHCQYVKEQMKKLGFAYPNDAMFWSMEILRNNYIRSVISSRFPEIIVDEAQDTSETQLKMIELLRESGSKIVLVGDPDQSIFEFGGARPDLFKGLEERWEFVELSRNFRSSQLICNATFLLSSELKEPSISTGETTDYYLKPLIIKYNPENGDELISIFGSILDKYHINKAKSIILAWEHDTLRKLLRAKSVSWPIRTASIIKAMAYGAYYRDNNRITEAHKQIMYSLLWICFEKTSFGPNNENISTIGIRDWKIKSFELLDNIPGLDRGLNDWIIELRSTLGDFLRKQNWPSATILSSSIKQVDANSGSRHVIDYIERTPQENEIPSKVIHKAKGETFDSVMVVCRGEKRGRKSDLEQWLAETGEHLAARRTGYVAVTRPRYLLVLAVPETTPNEILLRFGDCFEVFSE